MGHLCTSTHTTSGCRKTVTIQIHCKQSSALVNWPGDHFLHAKSGVMVILESKLTLLSLYIHK